MGITAMDAANATFATTKYGRSIPSACSRRWRAARSTRNRLSGHPGATSSAPVVLLSDRPEPPLKVIDERSFVGQHPIFVHVAPSVAIQRMR